MKSVGRVLFSLVFAVSVIGSAQAGVTGALGGAAAVAVVGAIAKNATTAPVNGGFKAKDVQAGKVNSCDNHYPFGRPQVNADVEKLARRSFFLCEENYAVQFDPATKTPIWVSEVLNGTEQKNTFVQRSDNFAPNPSVPKAAQASLNDYKGSGFDRGHMAPAADMLNESSMSESFYLTNMVPQVGPNMNRGIWADLEGVVRKWSVTHGQVYVVTGPIYAEQYPTMGHSNVAVPTHLYKVIIDPKTKENVAFIMPNKQIVTRKTKTLDSGNPNFPQSMADQAVNCSKVCIIDNFIVPLSEVERITNIQFFPNANGVNKSVKGRMWEANY